jgi:hypothetical protein
VLPIEEDDDTRIMPSVLRSWLARLYIHPSNFHRYLDS